MLFIQKECYLGYHQRKPCFNLIQASFLFQEVAKMAGWGDEQIEFMKEKITEEGRKEEVNKGKLPAQVKFFHSINLFCRDSDL